MYEIYRSLGDLMLDGLRHHLKYRPKETANLLRQGLMGQTLLNRAKAAQEQLFLTVEPEDRKFMWSDLQWQSGLYPPEEPKVSEKAEREAQQVLELKGGGQGAMYTILEEALAKSNLGWNWNPASQTTWQEEKEEEDRE